MQDNHLNKLIQKNFSELRNSTTNISQMCAIFYSEDILSNEECESIKNPYVNPTVSDQSDQLWKNILRKLNLLDDKTLQNILLKGDNQHLINIIWGQNYTGKGLFYQIRQKNDKFTGRNGLIEDFELKLKNHDISTSTFVFTLIGLGGIGKSSIAQHLAYTFRSQFSHILWFNSDDKSALIDQIMKIGQELEFFTQDSDRKVENTDKLLKCFMKWLENPDNSKWLIIFDNVNGYSDIKDYIPRSGGSVIITSRTKTGWINLIPKPVEKFEENEAIEYLSQILETPDKEEILELSKSLEFLPLALLHAGYYLQNTGESISEYLEILENNKKKFLEKWTEGSESLSVLASFEISFKKILDESSKAYKWLQTCSFYRPENIPKKFLQDFLNHDSEEMSKVQTLILKYCLMTLTHHGNFKINEEIKDQTFYSMHRLVQISIQYLLGLDQDLHFKRLQKSTEIVQKYRYENEGTLNEISHFANLYVSIIRYIENFAELGRQHGNWNTEIFRNLGDLFFLKTISIGLNYLIDITSLEDTFLIMAMGQCNTYEYYYEKIVKLSINQVKPLKTYKKISKSEDDDQMIEKTDEIIDIDTTQFENIFTNILFVARLIIKYEDMFKSLPAMVDLMKLFKRCGTLKNVISLVLKDSKMYDQFIDGFVQSFQVFEQEGVTPPEFFTKFFIALYKLFGLVCLEDGIEKSGVFEYLAITHYYSNDFEKCQDYAEQALQLQKNEFGENSKFILEKLRGIGEAYRELGNLDEANFYLSQVKEIKEKYSGQVCKSQARFLKKSQKSNFCFYATIACIILISVLLKFYFV